MADRVCALHWLHAKLASYGAWILEVAITTLLDFDAHVQTAEINATLPKPWQAVYDPESKAYYYWNTVCATNCTPPAWLCLALCSIIQRACLWDAQQGICTCTYRTAPTLTATGH